jgi:hypothetical protein
MGLAKRMRDEQLEAGFVLDDPWREVCPSCIDDEALKLHVARCGAIESCDFCGGPGPAGMRLEDLFKYMSGCLAAEWDDPANGVGWDSREGGWQGARVIDSDDLLWDLGGPLGNDELRAAFVGAFDGEWCQRNPYGLEPHERLIHGWQVFARYVKEEARYLFLRTGRAKDPDSEVVDPAEMLDELGTSIVHGGLIRQLPAGHRLCRARQHDPGEILVTSAALGSPPAGGPWANRMSPPGISMFYAAEDLDTAVAEIRPTRSPRCATVGSWTTARPLAYLDLVGVTVPSIFDTDARHQRPWLRFLRLFADEVAKPVTPDAGPVDYVPTQIVTEYVRHVLSGPAGESVRGIRYSSSLRPGGISWVLFVSDDGCCDAVPGWASNPGHWLGLDTSSLQRIDLGPRPTS